MLINVANAQKTPDATVPPTQPKTEATTKMQQLEDLLSEKIDTDITLIKDIDNCLILLW